MSDLSVFPSCLPQWLSVCVCLYVKHCGMKCSHVLICYTVYLSLNWYNVFFYYFDVFIVIIIFLHLFSKLWHYCIFYSHANKAILNLYIIIYIINLLLYLFICIYYLNIYLSYCTFCGFRERYGIFLKYCFPKPEHVVIFHSVFMIFVALLMMQKFCRCFAYKSAQLKLSSYICQNFLSQVLFIQTVSQ